MDGRLGIPDRKHTEKTQAENTERKHREKPQTENKDRKHRQKTQRENTDRKHREKTQRENTDGKHRQKTQRENTERKHRQKTQRENTERKHRQKTQTENTQTENGNTQRENTDRSATQYYKVLHNTIPYYKAPHATTPYHTVLHSTPRRGRESSPGSPASKANALSARQIFWDDRVQKIAIANTMRGATLQIQNTNVHTPRPMRGAIPRAQNLRFATVSRDRPTESYERVHPAKSKCAFRYSGAWRRQSPASYKNHRFTIVSDVRPPRSDEKVAPSAEKFAFHHSFGRPTSTKRRKGCASAQRICISPQFWASDDHFLR